MLCHPVYVFIISKGVNLISMASIIHKNQNFIFTMMTKSEIMISQLLVLELRSSGNCFFFFKNKNEYLLLSWIFFKPSCNCLISLIQRKAKPFFSLPLITLNLLNFNKLFSEGLRIQHSVCSHSLRWILKLLQIWCCLNILNLN